MTMPKKDDMYLPILKELASGDEFKNKEIATLMEKKYNLTDEEKNERVSSGKRRIDIRVSWAITHLKKAELVESKRRGYFNLTKEGFKVLDENPETIDNQYLLRYDSYKEFMQNNNSSSKNKKTKDIQKLDEKRIPTSEINQINDDSISPEEQFEKANNQINEQLKSDLLEEILRNSPDFFEQLVVDLLLSMGYGSTLEAGTVVGKSHDGGIDGVIAQDKLGLENIYVQAKRYKNTVEISKVRDFVGSLSAQNSNKGVFITTSSYSKDTIEFIKSANTSEKSIVLIDGEQLTELMIENNVGVSSIKTYEIKRLDADYFEEN